jgi:hypothetical protein
MAGIACLAGLGGCTLYPEQPAYPVGYSAAPVYAPGYGYGAVGWGWGGYPYHPHWDHDEHPDWHGEGPHEHGGWHGGPGHVDGGHPDVAHHDRFDHDAHD